MDSPDYRLWVALWRRTTKDDVVSNRCCCLHWTHQKIALDVCKENIEVMLTSKENIKRMIMHLRKEVNKVEIVVKDFRVICRSSDSFPSKGLKLCVPYYIWI